MHRLTFSFCCSKAHLFAHYNVCLGFFGGSSLPLFSAEEKVPPFPCFLPLSLSEDGFLTIRKKDLAAFKPGTCVSALIFMPFQAKSALIAGALGDNLQNRYRNPFYIGGPHGGCSPGILHSASTLLLCFKGLFSIIFLK